MIINTYEICNTDEEDHLNGQIIIINLDYLDSLNNLVGYAVVTITEGPFPLHPTLERITSGDGGVNWNGTHDRRGLIQNWDFEFIEDDRGSREAHTNSKYENRNYINYFKYSLDDGIRAIDGNKQGNGTGTAGGD